MRRCWHPWRSKLTHSRAHEHTHTHHTTHTHTHTHTHTRPKHALAARNRAQPSTHTLLLRERHKHTTIRNTSLRETTAHSHPTTYLLENGALEGESARQHPELVAVNVAVLLSQPQQLGQLLTKVKHPNLLPKNAVEQEAHGICCKRQAVCNVRSSKWVPRSETTGEQW